MWLLGWMQPLFWLLILTQGIPTYSIKCTQCDVDQCLLGSGKDSAPKECRDEYDSCYTQLAVVKGKRGQGNRKCAVFDETETKTEGCKTKPQDAGYAGPEFLICLCKADNCNSDEELKKLLGGASHSEISKALLWTTVVFFSVHRCNSILDGR